MKSLERRSRPRGARGLGGDDSLDLATHSRRAGVHRVPALHEWQDVLSLRSPQPRGRSGQCPAAAVARARQLTRVRAALIGSIADDWSGSRRGAVRLPAPAVVQHLRHFLRPDAARWVVPDAVWLLDPTSRTSSREVDARTLQILGGCPAVVA